MRVVFWLTPGEFLNERHTRLPAWEPFAIRPNAKPQSAG